MYWKSKIALHAREPKRLWVTFNNLLGRGHTGCKTIAPSYIADNIFEIFHRQGILCRDYTARSLQSSPTNSHLSIVGKVSGAELHQIILDSAPKSCKLDPSQCSLSRNLWTYSSPFLSSLANVLYKKASFHRRKKVHTGSTSEMWQSSHG